MAWKSKAVANFKLPLQQQRGKIGKICVSGFRVISQHCRYEELRLIKKDYTLNEKNH
jgi:hypothetical protein